MPDEFQDLQDKAKKLEAEIKKKKDLDEFQDLQDKAKKLEADIEKKKDLIEKSTKDLSEQADTIKNEVNTLLNEPLATSDSWEQNKDKQDEIRTKVNVDLPEKMKKIEDCLEQAQSGLLSGYDEAKFVVKGGIVLLAVLAVIYVGLHLYHKNPSYNLVKAGQFFESMGRVKSSLAKKEIMSHEFANALSTLKFKDEEDALAAEFSQAIGILKGIAKNIREYPRFEPAKPPKKAEQPTATETAKPPKKAKQPTATEPEEPPEEAKPPTATEAAKPPKESEASGASKNRKANGALSVPLQPQDPRVTLIKEILEDVEDRAKVLPKIGGFFWTWGGWRWLEVLFWGEFGVIVGILVWVSTQMLKSTYTKLQYKKEKFWYWTELAIGPIVVVAVFFLFKQVIGNIIKASTGQGTPGPISIYMTLGISFALGLFLRRTLGVFDRIKQVLPVPGVERKPSEQGSK